MGKSPMVLTAIEGFSVNSGLYQIICMIDGDISVDVCAHVSLYSLALREYDEGKSNMHTWLLL